MSSSSSKSGSARNNGSGGERARAGAAAGTSARGRDGPAGGAALLFPARGAVPFARRWREGPARATSSSESVSSMTSPPGSGLFDRVRDPPGVLRVGEFSLESTLITKWFMPMKSRGQSTHWTTRMAERRERRGCAHIKLEVVPDKSRCLEPEGGTRVNEQSGDLHGSEVARSVTKVPQTQDEHQEGPWWSTPHLLIPRGPQGARSRYHIHGPAAT